MIRKNAEDDTLSYIAEQSGCAMGKKTKKSNCKDTAFAQSKAKNKMNIRFIVPMPGRLSWQSPSAQLSFNKFHSFADRAGDFALEDYQAQFLMQREYLID